MQEFHLIQQRFCSAGGRVLLIALVQPCQNDGLKRLRGRSRCALLEGVAQFGLRQLYVPIGDVRFDEADELITIICWQLSGGWRRTDGQEGWRP